MKWASRPAANGGGAREPGLEARRARGVCLKRGPRGPASAGGYPGSRVSRRDSRGEGAWDAGVEAWGGKMSCRMRLTCGRLTGVE